MTNMEYEEFMRDTDNAGKCYKCPENQNYQGKLHCGQQSCCVRVHCEETDEEE